MHACTLYLSYISVDYLPKQLTVAPSLIRHHVVHRNQERMTLLKHIIVAQC